MITPPIALTFAMLAGSLVLRFSGPATAVSAMPASPAIPAVPAIADDSTLLSYTVDSVRVIQRLTPTTDVVAVNIYLLGGARQLTAATQGIEAMLVSASKFGTRSHPDSTLRMAWANTGSVLESEMTSDWTMIGFRGIRDEFERSWDLITERLTQPTFPSAGVTTARKQAACRAQAAAREPRR